MGAATAENSTADPQKFRTELPCDKASPIPEYLSKGYENTNSERHMHQDAHCSIIYSNQIWKHPAMSLMGKYVKKTRYINM